MSLTAVQQDYIEIIYTLERNPQLEKIRISDIASKLGTRLPTVTRTVKKLTTMGFLNHENHGNVSLTDKGQTIANEISHLHSDLVFFFTSILGVNRKLALNDACQLEHGFSRLSAQRLHEFLEYYKKLSDNDKKVFDRFLSTISKKTTDFNHLPENKTSGWRF